MSRCVRAPIARRDVIFVFSTRTHEDVLADGQERTEQRDEPPVPSHVHRTGRPAGGSGGHAGGHEPRLQPRHHGRRGEAIGVGKLPEQPHSAARRRHRRPATRSAILHRPAFLSPCAGEANGGALCENSSSAYERAFTPAGLPGRLGRLPFGFRGMRDRRLAETMGRFASRFRQCQVVTRSGVLNRP